MISYRNTLLIVALLPISQPMSPTILRPGAAIRSLNPFIEDPSEYTHHLHLSANSLDVDMHGDTTLGNSNPKSVARDIRKTRQKRYPRQPQQPQAGRHHRLHRIPKSQQATKNITLKTNRSAHNVSAKFCKPGGKRP